MPTATDSPLPSPPSLSRLLPWSRALGRLFAAHPAWQAETAAHLPRALTHADLLAGLPAALDEDSLKPALRGLRQRAWARLAARDLAGLADLAEVTHSMTLMAEVSLRLAQQVLGAALTARYGTPRNAAGETQQLMIIAMGKLGGGELNVSSDIDLIFLYAEDGETDGRDSGLKSIDNFEFFTRLARQLINALADITGEGQVFRVDMRLRPNGDSGPLVCSLDMLENYFITQGREWERYAWIKARLLAPPAGTDPGLWARWQQELEALRRPFVFRKYLDFGAIDAMRELRNQIRREVARRDMADNIKLGPGGIREIEFIAQVFQLIRGGRDTDLQCQPTLEVLPLLAQKRKLSRQGVQQLIAAYHYLRRLEHRLQYLDDAQTHSLPQHAADQALVAAAMGHADYAALLDTLSQHRQVVGHYFDAVLADPEASTPAAGDIWQDAQAQPGAAADDETIAGNSARLANLGYRDARQSAQRLHELRSSQRYQQLPEHTQQRLDTLVPQAIAACARTSAPDAALNRSLTLFESVSRRPAYLALLLQYPPALSRLTQLLAASAWAADYLLQHPILLDELLDPTLLEPEPDWPAFMGQLDASLTAAGDTEQQLDLLREAHHSQVFRLLVQDIGGLLSVERLADHLSALADGLLALILKHAWQQLPRRHRDMPRLAIIAYGKLGGKELGYASDLDLVYLMDDDHPQAGENHARLATRLTSWLSTQTAAGQLFDVDLRLRPNGESGLPVSDLAGFRQYQLNSAWTWEHQALTRARYCAGDARIGAAFEAIRIEVLRQPRDLTKLGSEVLGMRERMRGIHATPADQAGQRFNLKHDRGGLVDVEFMVQYLVLGHAHQHAQLTGNLGNIALLKIAAELGLIDAAHVAPVQEAYRDYRRRQHLARLNNQAAIILLDGTLDAAEAQAIAAQRASVCALWQELFGDLQT